MATMPPNANVVFLPWVRQGAAGAIGVADTNAPQRSTVDLTAALTVNSAPPVPVTVRLRGPADVIGIDPHEIVRMDPRPGSTDFEPNYFAAIEFDRPDFPWLFTPLRADGQARLRPWLCLVVVRKQDGVVLRSTADAPLPTLEISAPARPADELPDLSESWLWAHTQAASPAGVTAAELRSTIGGNPELSLSRLMCPRILEPNADYIACVVPTFEPGRKAGLGQEITEAELTNATGLKPAWTVTPAPTIVTLPVYHHWRFRTGEGGDFESLVRLLQPRSVPPTLGKRPIDISGPGFALPADFPAGATLEIEGALKPMEAAAMSPWPAKAQAPFQGELAKIVNAPGLAQAIDPKADPLLAPPVYGRWHAARPTVTAGATPWLDELNLDPRHRCVAAFGTRVVQEHQEALMAAAWEQAADLQRANQRLRQLQLSLFVGTSLHTRHFKAFEPDAMLRVAAPALGRLRTDAANAAAPTLVATLSGSALPVRATSAPMRRIGRDRGPIARRVAAQGGTPAVAVSWMASLNLFSFSFMVPPPIDLASFSLVRGRVVNPAALRTFAGVTEPIVAAMRGRPSFRVSPEGQPVIVPPVLNLPESADGSTAKNFRAAATRHLARINPGRVVPTVLQLPSLALAGIRDSVVAQTNPARALVSLARAVVSTGANATPPTSAAPAPADVPIGTIMFAPKFRQPMYAPLRDLSPELLLPGLEAVSPNTVLGLKTNRRFVEAYMVGLNFEMARELLWRGFPTDQRGTCFDQFWDVRGATGVTGPDVTPLHQWANGVLGTAQQPPVREQFVMLLRSDLLRRYPTAVIYATKAVRVNGVPTPSSNPADEVPPTFRGALPPDVSFFGFNLTIDAVLGRGPGASPDGYFIVIQEQPTEPRFGLDVGTPTSTGTHLRLGASAPRNAAHLAAAMRQQPVRVAIHASQFVAQP